MSRQSGAVESCHTQWSVSVIILYKQVRKVNSTLWQCHTTKSYIICKPSEQWTVPQWSLYFCCKKMHLICDAGGGGRGKLLIVQESKVNWKFTFQSNLKKKGKKKRKRHHGCKTQQNHAWNPSETEMKAHSLQGTEETARHGWMGRCSSHHGIHRAAKLNREDWHNFNCNNFFMNN